MEQALTPVKEILNIPDMPPDNDSQPTYLRTSLPSSDKGKRRHLKRRPIIRAELTPEQILTDIAETIKPILRGWGFVREKMGWSEYAQKLRPDTREIMVNAFRELRRNGYCNPRVRDDKLIVDYICFHSDDQTSKTMDICTLCERPCYRKDWRGVFRTDKDNDEVMKCWE